MFSDIPHRLRSLGRIAVTAVALTAVAACGSDGGDEAIDAVTADTTDAIDTATVDSGTATVGSDTADTADTTSTSEGGASTEVPSTDSAPSTEVDAGSPTTAAEAGDDSEPVADSIVETDGSGTDASSDATAGDAPGCAELRRVTEMDDLESVFDDLFDPDLSEEDFVAALREAADVTEDAIVDVVELYRKAAAAVEDAEVAEVIERLASTTETLTDPIVDAYRRATTFEELDAILTENLGDPEVSAAAEEGGQAALRLDEFTLAECGFQISGA